MLKICVLHNASSTCKSYIKKHPRKEPLYQPAAQEDQNNKNEEEEESTYMHSVCRHRWSPTLPYRGPRVYTLHTHTQRSRGTFINKFLMVGWNRTCNGLECLRFPDFVLSPHERYALAIIWSVKV